MKKGKSNSPSAGALEEMPEHSFKGAVRGRASGSDRQRGQQGARDYLS